MNSTALPVSCLYNASTCYFIDVEGHCLSDDKVLNLILKYVIPTYYEWICIVLYVVVFFVGTIGNLLVIIVIQRNRSMRTVTNMFIMNLAAADLLVLVFCLPATVIQDVTKTWFFGLVFCKFINYIQNMSISVSVLTLMAISIERYQAIVHPLKFTGTKQRARILILTVWVLSILLVLPDAIMMTLSRQYGDRIETIYLTYCQWNVDPFYDLLYQLHISLCLFVIPLSFMVFTYSGIARILWGSLPTERMFNDDKRVISASQNTLTGQLDEPRSNHHNGGMTSGSSLMGQTKSANLIVQENRQKAAKMLISVVIIFAICYLPVHVFNLFRYVYVYFDDTHQSPEHTGNTDENMQCFEPRLVSLERTGTIKIVTISALVAHFLPYFNSSINPIIYNIMSDKFRLKFRELFSSCCCCCKTAKMKLTSSTMIPFKSSTALLTYHAHPSPKTVNANNRSMLNSTHLKRNINDNSLTVTGGGGGGNAVAAPAGTNICSTSSMTRHSAINKHGYGGTFSARLTNV